MAHRWKVLAFALLLVAPGIASAADPEDARNYTWVEENVLARGGGGLDRDDVDFLHREGFRAVADFRHEHDDPEDYLEEKGMAYLDLPIEHTVDINVTQLETFVEWAKAQEAEGHTVYAHCTRGWHRAAAFAAAWVMEREGLTYDEAAERLEASRSGTVLRTPGPLLQYQARLMGEPGLSVILHAERSHPPQGGSMPAAVEVLLPDGSPAEGAQVHVWSEEGDMNLKGETDAHGRLEFTYRAPSDHVLDHLSARASLPGYVDGADNVEMFFFGEGEERGPTQVNATLTDEGIHVRAESDYEDDRTPTRFVATSESGWFATEASVRAEATLPEPPAGETVHVRAEVWGGETGHASVETPEPEPATYAPDEDAPREGSRGDRDGPGGEEAAPSPGNQVSSGAALGAVMAFALAALVAARIR